MRQKRVYTEHSSPLYKEIYNSKHNRDVLPNGDIRIGETHIICYKTKLIKKYQAATGSLRIFTTLN